MKTAVLKKCVSCQEEKPADSFHSARNRPDGRYPYCKDCCKAKLAERAKRDVEGEARRKQAKREYDARRYKANAKDIRAKVQRRYEAKSETIKAYVRDWQKQNAELVKAYKTTSKHKRRAITEKGLSGPELLRWAKAQPKSCYWCDAKCADGYHIDHYVPLSRGGKHEVSNLVISCPTCNLRKHAKDPLDFAQEVGRLL